MTSPSAFSSLAAIPEEKITDKITRRVLAGEKGMMVWWTIGAGTHVAAHSHPHEQLSWIVKGRMEFRVDKERGVLGSRRHRGDPRRCRARGLVPRRHRDHRHIRAAT